jgi:hypothetical protein
MGTPQRKTPVLIALLALLSVAALLDAQEAAEQTKAPRTIVPQSVVDVGRVAKGEVVEHTFEFINEGDATLRILRVKPTCGCTVTEHDKQIEPGATGKLTAKLTTAEFRGPIAKSIRVYTNDTANPEVTLVIKADVRAQIDVSPGYARFVVVEGETYGTKEQIIWSPDFETLEVTKVDSPFAFVETSFRKLEKGDSDFRRDSDRWEVAITLDEDAPIGPMADYIRVSTNHPQQKVVRIPVSGIVRPILAVTPQVADFGRRDPTEAHETTLEVKNLGKIAVELEGATTDIAGLEAEVESVEAGRLFNVLLKLQPGMPKGRFRGKVTVQTNSPKQPVLEIDVTGIVI